jgi:hypothetical protein
MVEPLFENMGEHGIFGPNITLRKQFTVDDLPKDVNKQARDMYSRVHRTFQTSIYYPLMEDIGEQSQQDNVFVGSEFDSEYTSQYPQGPNRRKDSQQRDVQKENIQIIRAAFDQAVSPISDNGQFDEVINKMPSGRVSGPDGWMLEGPSMVITLTH